MASVTLNSVITESFIKSFQGLASGSSSSSIQNALKGGAASTASVSSTLRIGAQTYATAISGLNSLITYINLSKQRLEDLGKVTDKLITLTERATQPGVGQDGRNSLDRQFKKLAAEFQKIVADSKVGSRNYLDRDGLAELFTLVGLDKTTADSVADQFAKFLVSKKDTKLASEYEKGKRPVPIPPSAYVTEGVSYTTESVGSGSFAAQVSVRSNYGNPYSVKVADLDGDGYGDIVNSDSTGGSSVSVLIGNGNGTFKRNISYATTAASLGVGLADLNGDGETDIVNAGGIGVSGAAVLLNNGNGTFLAAVSYEAGTESYEVGLADFDNDGSIDLATPSSTDGSLSVLLGNGNGTFKAKVTFADGSDQRAIATADLDGDGNTDIASASYSTNSVNIFLNPSGNASFSTAVTYAVGANPTGIALADLNRDGIKDAVSTNSGDSSVSVLLGAGSGTFGSATSFDISAGAIGSAELYDVNTDGYTDIVVSDGSSNSYSVLLGNGDGSFKARTSYSSPNGARALTAGDLNADGVRDIVVAENTSQSLGVFLANTSSISVGPGSFNSPTSFATSATPDQVVVKDFDGDGLNDMAALIEAGTSTFQLSIGNGNGSFKAAVSYNAGQTAVWADSVDLNNDSYFDLIAVNHNNNSAQVLLNNGNGTFAAPISVSTSAFGANLDAVSSADFNSDGYSDLAVTASNGDGIAVLIGNGNGTFKVPVSYVNAGTDPTSITNADINNDGKIDLITSDSTTGRLGIYLGNGNGSFKARTSTSAAGTNAVQINIKDFNGDGNLDLASGGSSSGKVYLELGNGDGTFRASTSYSAYGSDIYGVTSSDFNLDGIKDIATVSSDTTRTVSILIGNGNGTFQAANSFYFSESGARWIEAADINSDSAPDLITANSSGNSISVFTGEPAAQTQLSRTTTEYDTLFESGRNIRRRTDAYQMMHDLKALRKQIKENSKQLEQATELVGKNMQLVRAAGFAFLNLSSQVKGDETAAQLAESIRDAIRKDAGAALSQAENLQAITVAALALNNSSSSE